MTTKKELAAFFAATGSGHATGTFRSVGFAVVPTLDPSPMSEPIEGEQFVAAGFGRSLAADARVESRRYPDSDDDDLLAAYFTWSATSDTYLRSVIHGRFLDVLVALAKRYPTVVVTDDWAGFGAVQGRTPAELAGHLAALVAVIPRLDGPSAEPDGPIDESSPAAGDDAFMCYFCGATFAQDLATCPACKAELDND